MKTGKSTSKQKIPSNAKRVFKGIIFDVYQWEQKLFDGTTATFEKIKRQDTAMVIPITEEGRFIVTQEKQPGEKSFVGLVGGRVDPGEKPLEAAKRELLEETGYKAKKFILWDKRSPGGKIDWTLYTYIAKGCFKVSQATPGAGEKIKTKLITFEELIDLFFSPNFRDKEVALKLLKDGVRTVVDNPNKMRALKRTFLK